MQECVGGVFDIHDAVPPACLQRAQALIDLLLKPPPRPSKHSGGIVTAHPLCRVLDIVAAAQAKAAKEEQSEGSIQQKQQQEEETNGMAGTSYNSGDGDFVLQALRESLGVAEGGTLYRHWVHDPRVFLDGVVARLAHCVRQNILPILLQQRSAIKRDEALENDNEVDVHVQLYPSLSAAASSCVAPTLREASKSGGVSICAAVVIRRLSALRRRANAQAALYERFMSVAAEGQTLQSALDFWDAVSYGDVVSREGRSTRGAHDDLRAFRPLGLVDITTDEDESSNDDSDECFSDDKKKCVRKRQRTQQSNTSRRSVSCKQEEEVDDDVVVVKKEKRDDEEEDTSSDTTISASSDAEVHVEHRVRVSKHVDDEAERPPAVILGEGTQGRFSQPAALLVSQSTSARPTTRMKPGLLRQDMCGLVAVLYISLQGVAYVGYPTPSPRRTTLTHVPQTNMKRSEEGVKKEETRKDKQPSAMTAAVPWLLPLDAATSFTRGLLGLS